MRSKREEKKYMHAEKLDFYVHISDGHINFTLAKQNHLHLD